MSKTYYNIYIQGLEAGLESLYSIPTDYRANFNLKEGVAFLLGFIHGVNNIVPLKEPPAGDSTMGPEAIIGNQVSEITRSSKALRRFYEEFLEESVDHHALKCGFNELIRNRNKDSSKLSPAVYKKIQSDQQLSLDDCQTLATFLGSSNVFQIINLDGRFEKMVRQASQKILK
ncbi:hypothetical protein KC866_01745 [Patescibacteria group bacterium]|nr:hypothetical protein [Patescibacteria group bacterium]